jgi:hypothetical protein
VIGGDLKKSELIRRISLPRGHEDLMPQEAEPISGPHKNWLTDWVRTGAKWPDGVVLKPKKREVPGIVEKQFIPERGPATIHEAAKLTDTILEKENALAAQKAPVAKVIPDLAFLRRATVDLVGRIPTSEEVERFENESPSTRREQLVDRLLANPRFSERWTVFFADMLRVRSQAEGGSQLLAYVNRCLTEKKPYDEMVRELIATNGRADQAPAAGFVLGDAANPMALAGATSQIFLGVRLQCAECHDHPFDDWKQKEFYELAAFFGLTKRIETPRTRRVYTTEGVENSVKWPPEREQPPKREGVNARFPFEMISYTKKPDYIARLEDRRRPIDPASPNSAASKKALDDLLDSPDVKFARVPGGDVLAEASSAAKRLDISQSLYRSSKQRKQLAELITDPRNPYFARAFVNRVWAELVGRGFVEPLDNISAYNEIRNPQTLQFLAQEFTANGYDVRTLVKTIMLTATYQRDHLPVGASAAEVARAEESFTATRSRRMLGEVLFDSIVAAGHLDEFKWPSGANRREVTRQVRVPIAPPMPVAAPKPTAEEPSPAMMAVKPTMPAVPYDQEKGVTLNFEELLNQDTTAMGKKGKVASEALLAEAKNDIEMKMKKEDEKMEAERQARIRALQSGTAERFRLETIKEVIDDNPRFDSTFRMATPAPPSHFLRVFGQPARENLGEFRDEAPSLRQELLMLNGKATHEASRVGPLEPIYKFITGQNPQVEKAVELSYLEILTRRPTAQEIDEARSIVGSAAKPIEGLSDLRWALLNCHEFRYLP